MSSVDSVRSDESVQMEPTVDPTNAELRRRMRRRLELENERVLALETSRRRAVQRQRLDGRASSD